MTIHSTDVVASSADKRMEQHEADLISEAAARPSWRQMSWHERAEAVARVVFGFGDDIVTVITANNIVPKKVKWLWPNRVPLGKLTLFVGDPDNGKSLVATYVAATVTTGRDWYDADKSLASGEVLIFAGEDDPEDTGVPRLMAAGANNNKIHFAKMISDNPNARQEEREMRLDTDVAAIKKALERNPNIRLIIIDPVSNYLGTAKMNEEQAVRRVLSPLQALAAETGVAILGIMHLNKKGDQPGIHRIGGAMAFVGVARAVWLFASDKDNPGIFHMARVKNNICERRGGLMYRIATKNVEIEGRKELVPYVEWLGRTDLSADDLLAAKQVGRPRGKRNDGLEWLEQLLSEGPKPAKEIEARCEAEGFSYRTLERAKVEAGVQSVKGDDGWYWELIQRGSKIQEPQNS